MPVPPMRVDTTPSTYFPKNNQYAVESARKATSKLLTQFETFLEGLVKHQVKQGHFKKRYEIPGYALSTYRVVNGARYEGVHALYSNKTEKTHAVEALSEAMRLLTDLYESIPSDYFQTWQATIKKLDVLILDKQVYALVDEYLDTLPLGTRQTLKKEAKKNMEICHQALCKLSDSNHSDIHSNNRQFEPLTRLLTYEGIHSIYEGMHSVYTDPEKREKIVEALRGVTNVLADMYEMIPAHCIDTWQATLKKLDNLALDNSIHTFAQEYIYTFPSEAYGFLNNKIEVSLVACKQALEDLKEAQRVTPSPLFGFFSNLLSIGLRFFERVSHLLQPLVDKQTNMGGDVPGVATAA